MGLSHVGTPHAWAWTQCLLTVCFAFSKLFPQSLSPRQAWLRWAGREVLGAEQLLLRDGAAFVRMRANAPSKLSLQGMHFSRDTLRNCTFSFLSCMCAV